MAEPLHPALPCLAGAVVVALVPARRAGLVALAAAAASLALAWLLPAGAAISTSALAQELVWLRADPLARVFAIAFALIAALGSLYALATPGRRLLVAALVAAGAAQGIALAGDWVTLYAAWETLALASSALVLDGGRPAARAAGIRYLLVHVAGGALLLAGVVAHLAAGGSHLVGPLDAAGPGVLILLGFAVNAAIPPLHGWLVDAYPESSPAGTVFLSAFATKAAVYALARVFPGAEILVAAGAVMALYGVLFAVVENDARRLLGYHIVSQVGYMVAGVGLGTPLALSGVAAHAFCHILYKGLLLMGAGAILHATGRRRLTDLGGLAVGMPATALLYMVGALSISGAPLLNGFVSKSMIVAAAEAEHRPVVAGALLLASVGTFLSVGLKLPCLAFLGRRRGPAPAPVPRAMVGAMAATAALCAATGLAPAWLYALLPDPVAWRPYTAGHVLESLQILTGCGLGFALLRGRLGGKATVSLDADRLYRVLGRAVTGAAVPAVARAAAAMEAAALGLADARLAVPRLAVAAPIGFAVLIAVLVLGAGLGIAVVLR